MQTDVVGSFVARIRPRYMRIKDVRDVFLGVLQINLCLILLLCILHGPLDTTRTVRTTTPYFLGQTDPYSQPTASVSYLRDNTFQ